MSKSFGRKRKRIVKIQTFEFSSSEDDDQEEGLAIKIKELDQQPPSQDNSQTNSSNFNNNNINTNFNLESSFVSNYENSVDLSGDLHLINRPITTESGVALSIAAKPPIQDSSLIHSLLNSYTNTSKNIITNTSIESYRLDNGGEETNAAYESGFKCSSVLKDLDNAEKVNKNVQKHKFYLKNRYKRFKKKQQLKKEDSSSGSEEGDEYSKELIEDLSTSLHLPGSTIEPSNKETEKSNLDDCTESSKVNKFKSQKSILKSIIKQSSGNISKQDQEVLCFSLAQVRDDLLGQATENINESNFTQINMNEDPNYENHLSRENFDVDKRNTNIQNFTNDLDEIMLRHKPPYIKNLTTSLEEWMDLGYRLHRLVYNIEEDDGFLRFIKMYEKETVSIFLNKVVDLKWENKTGEFFVSLASILLEKHFDADIGQKFLISEELRSYVDKIKDVFQNNKRNLKKGITGLYLEQEHFIAEKYF